MAARPVAARVARRGAVFVSYRARGDGGLGALRRCRAARAGGRGAGAAPRGAARHAAAHRRLSGGPAVLCGRLRSARLHHLDHHHSCLHPAFRRALCLDDDDRTRGRHRGRMSSTVRVLAAGDPADRLPVGQTSVLISGPALPHAVFDAIGIGFATALTLKNIIYCFVGAFVGTVVGVLPGLGPVATISLLLPFSFTMDITSAIILMAGIFYGAQYGGSIPAILVRIPGEASAVVTCLDGYAMARKGRAGAALGIAAFGSFIAGILVTIALFLVGPAMSGVALAFGPAEYTALVLLGLLLVTQLSSGSQTKALLMVSFGLLLSTVGRAPLYGAERFTFGIFSIYDGLNMALLAMGLFGVAELLVMAGGGAPQPIPAC